MSTIMKGKSPENLKHCPECKGVLIYPIAWKEIDDEFDSWWLHIRCPDCESSYEIVAPHNDVMDYDEHLNRSTDQLIEFHRVLKKHNMESDIVLFKKALEGNHILPEDFGRP